MNAGGRSEQTLAAAMEHHRAGRLIDAERLYRSVCDADPKNARAFHLLGVVAHQLKRPDAASLVGRAVTLDPDFAEAHNDRGVILAANGLFARGDILLRAGGGAQSRDITRPATISGGDCGRSAASMRR